MQSYIKELKNILMLLCLVVAISFIFANEINIIVMAMTIIIMCCCVYLSSVFIIYKSDKGTINSIFKYLSIGFAGVGIIALSYIYSINTAGLDEIKIYGKLGKTFFLSMFYEPFSCIGAFWFYNKKISIKKYIWISFIFVSVAIHYSLYSNSQFINKNFLLGFSIPKLIVNLLFIATYIYLVHLIRENKQLMTKSIYRYFNKYIVSKILMQTVIIFSNFSYNKLIIISLLLITTLGDYYIIHIMVIEVIKSPQEVLYKSLYDKSVELKNIVNDLKIAKKEVEVDADKSNSIIKNLPNGIVILEEGKIVYANNEFIRMLDIKEYRDILQVPFVQLIDEEYKKIIDQPYKKYIRKAINGRIDIKLKYKGTSIYGEVSGIELGYYSLRRVIFMIRNISDRKELEKVEGLLEEKKRNEQIKNELLTNISHEFKTPVNVIYSAIQIQNLKINSGDLNEILKYNKTIKQNCYRLIRLINNFIDTTRLDEGGLSADKNYLNIVSLIEDTTTSVLSFAENAGINIIFDTDEEEVIVFADSQLIERVALNLLSNAIKYSSRGGKIEVNIITKKKTVDIVVHDNGIGIPEEKQYLLFNRFERIDKSLSRSKEGSGLGLNIVRKIVELHNGEIRLRSRYKIGTEVTITLPRVENESDIIKNNYNEIEKNSRCNSNVEMEMSDIYL